MSRWDYYWNYYTPKPPKPVKDGIKAKSQRGNIGKTWWSKRWIEVLEAFGMGARLGRGRSYARQGQVVSIDIAEGIVKARVQGTRSTPYKITIEIKPLSATDWNKVTDAMAEQAIFAAKLLAGEMPQDIEAAFHEAKIALFPKSVKELATDCSCPDWANPCKHIAAVYFILAEQFDEDPFLIFKLRGKDKGRLIEELRQKRGDVSAAPQDFGSENELEPMPMAAPLAECLDSFWRAGAELKSFSANPVLPEVDCALLKRLGNAPFAAKRKNMSVWLEEVYQIVSHSALAKALGEF